MSLFAFIVKKDLAAGGQSGKEIFMEEIMPSLEYTRTTGQHLTYTITYDRGEYFIQRDGKMKKSVPDAMALGISPHEAKAPLMLRMAIADIEALLGMDE
ncbi:MAG TPA: hypothetical protein VJ577_11830 [Burkholderiaceae bacterium]|nr:hypothetical protein [Burkholderiaceae bacterium]